MSSQTDMQALVAKNTRLEAQLEIMEGKSASRIKKLEQEVVALELDKRMSAAKTNTQAPVLQGEIARLQQEVAAKDAIIAERDEEVSGLLRTISSCRETLTALTQDLSHTVKGKAAPKAHEPPKEPMPNPTPSPGLTPVKFPIDTAPASTASSRQDYVQALWRQALPTPREKPSLRRASFDRTLHPFSVVGAELSARKEAEQQARSKSQGPLISQKPIRAHNYRCGRPRGYLRGRGDPWPNKGQTLHDRSFTDAKPGEYSLKALFQPIQMIQPADVGNSTELRVTKVTGGGIQPSRNPYPDPLAATSRSPAWQVLTEKAKEPSSDLRGDAAPFISKSTSIEDLEKQTGLTAEEILPPANDAMGTIPQVGAQPVLKFPQSVVPDAKLTTETNVVSGLEGVMTPSGPSTSRNTPGIQKVEPDSSMTPQSSVNKRLPPPGSIKESSNDSSAMNSQGANVAATHSKMSSQFPSSAAVVKDKKDSSGLRGEAAPFIAESEATAVPGTGGEWDAETTEVFRYFGYRLPTGVDKTKAAIQGVTTPTRESEGTSPNIKKRSGDEEQAGTSASSKRLRST